MAKDERKHRATGRPVGRPRKVKITNDLLETLPHRITAPTEWETLPPLDEEWITRARRVLAHLDCQVRPFLDKALDEARKTVAAMDWTQESTEHLIAITAHASGVHRALGRLRGVGDYDEAADLWLSRLYFQRKTLGITDEDGGTWQIIYLLVYCLAAQEAAEAEIRRRAAQHPGWLTAWLAIEKRDDYERLDRRSRGEPEPPIPARLAENARAARDYFACLFVDQDEEGGLLHGYITNRRLLAALDADEPDPATRPERTAGALYEQLHITLGHDWVNQEKYSDYAILADGLAGKLDGEPTKLTRRMVDRARPRWEQLKREIALDEERTGDDAAGGAD